MTPLPWRGPRALTAITAALSVAVLCGCGSGAPPSAASLATSGPKPPDYVIRPIVDPSEVNAPRRRIVCAAPNLTEICCALGLRDQIVGRTRFCTYPPGIETVPDIGALVDTNIETLLALKADLLLVSGRSRAMTERFEQLNVRFESLPDNTLEDIYTSIRRVGELTGRPRSAAGLVEAIRRDVERVAEHYRTLPPTRVLLVVGALSDPPTPPIVAGSNSFLGELLAAAKQRNIISFEDRAFGPIALEVVVQRWPECILELDPDGLLRPGGDADALRVWRQIGPIDPVERRRIHVIRGPQHYLPGPRIAETLSAFLQAIASSHDNLPE